MERNNPVRDKSYQLAILVVHICHILQDKREYVLSKQLLKSGTSIGANIHEALYAQTKPDFISKLHISLKEANETQFWLRLLKDTGIASEEQVRPLQQLLSEVLALLISILKKSKQKY